MFSSKARGTNRTASYCINKKYIMMKKVESANFDDDPKPYRPVLVIKSIVDKDLVIESIRYFIIRNKIQYINIAGHRESTAPVKNFTEVVKNLLVQALKGFTYTTRDFKSIKEKKQPLTDYDRIRLKKVISGGQTGADRAGLEAAKKVGLQTGGFAPKGFKTENGPDFSLKKFGLEEAKAPGYVARTKLNVDHSDGTIAIRLHDSNGTDKTIGYCQKKKWEKGIIKSKNKNVYRPVLIIYSLKSPDVPKIIANWIKNNNIETVNIAGHREKTAGVDNFQKTLQKILEKSFKLCMEE